MSRTYLPRGFDYRSLDTPTTTVPMSPQQLANHAVARLRCSLFAGIDLQLMTANGLMAPNSVVLPKGAAVQDDRGTDGWQAAHALPSGLIVAGTPIHLHAHGSASKQHLSEPYRVTNVVPRVVNVADQKAERFRRRHGLGLINAFANFGQKQVGVEERSGSKIDSLRLQASYSQLVVDYSRSFELLLAHLPLIEVTKDEYGMIDPKTLQRSEQENKIEEYRTILRHQLRATLDLGYSALHPHVVEEAEHDFYTSLKEDKPESKNAAAQS